jgi:hypothetical protein
MIDKKRATLNPSFSDYLIRFATSIILISAKKNKIKSVVKLINKFLKKRNLLLKTKNMIK